MSRDKAFRNNWTAITNKCTLNLTNLILQDLNNKYQTTKTEIDANLAQLQEILSNSLKARRRAKEEDDILRGDNSNLEEHQSKIKAKVTLNHY